MKSTYLICLYNKKSCLQLCSTVMFGRLGCGALDAFQTFVAHARPSGAAISSHSSNLSALAWGLSGWPVPHMEADSLAGMLLGSSRVRGIKK